MGFLLAAIGITLIVAGTVILFRSRGRSQTRTPELRLVRGSGDVTARPLGNLGRSASRLRGLGLDSSEIARILGVATGEVDLLLASRRSRAL